MNKQITTIYKWTDDGWVVWDRRIVLEGARRARSERNTEQRKNPYKPPRSRPCWWNNGVEEAQSRECPEGWEKGRLATSRRSDHRRYPCTRCGRVLYSHVKYREHGCINAK